MWKIQLEYNDGSKCSLTGKHKEIPLELAKKYYNDYVAGKVMKKSIYQQYPKKNNEKQDLYDYIQSCQVEDEEEE